METKYWFITINVYERMTGAKMYCNLPIKADYFVDVIKFVRNYRKDVFTSQALIYCRELTWEEYDQINQVDGEYELESARRV